MREGERKRLKINRRKKSGEKTDYTEIHHQHQH